MVEAMGVAMAEAMANSRAQKQITANATQEQQWQCVPGRIVRAKADATDSMLFTISVCCSMS